MKGIIIADKIELNSFPFELKETKKINQFIFYIFKNDLIVVNSGVGIANSSAATQELISSFKVSVILNYGAVGATDKLSIYELVIPEKIYFHDVITPWYKRGQTPYEKPFFLNDAKRKKKYNLGSGSSFVNQKVTVNSIKEEIDIDIFDMETASIAQIADKNNIPIKVYKCVSDIIGYGYQNELDDINQRITKAAKIAFEALVKDL